MRRTAIASFVLFVAGCGDAPPAPADAATGDRPQPSTCVLRVTPAEPQVLRASGRATFTARVTPPTPGMEARFALVGDALDGTLSTTRATLGPDGSASTELTAPTTATMFRLRATVPCTAEVYVPVAVTMPGLGAVTAEAVYRGARTPLRMTLSLFRAADCASTATLRAERDVPVPLPGGTVRFGDLAAGADYVVRAVASGRDDVELAAACAGPARVMADGTARVVATFTDAPLRLAAAYDLALAFDLTPTAMAAAPRWAMPVARDLSRAGGDAALLGAELANAVATAAPAATRDRDRAAFEAAWRDRLGAMVTAQLDAREARLEALFTRLAASTASVTADARATARASVTADDRERFLVEDVRYVLDPDTPDVRGDDVEAPAAGTARLRLAAGAGDARATTLDGLPMPFNAVARSALAAWLARQGVASSAEYAALSVCAVVAPAVRGATGACDDACVASACRRAIAPLGAAFDAAITTLTPARMLVDLRADATPTAAAASLTVDRLAGVATGGFRDEAGASVRAAALLTRAAP